MNKNAWYFHLPTEFWCANISDCVNWQMLGCSIHGCQWPARSHKIGSWPSYAARIFQISIPTCPMTWIFVGKSRYICRHTQSITSHLHGPSRLQEKTTTFQIWKTIRFPAWAIDIWKCQSSRIGYSWDPLRLLQAKWYIYTYWWTWWTIHHPAIGVSCSFQKKILIRRIYVSGLKTPYIGDGHPSVVGNPYNVL